MFLNRLESNEKKAFLLLAHHIARSDGDFSENEKNIISTYCLEMQISDADYDEDSFDLDDIMGEFQNKEHQKIVMLEIMALVYSDGLKTEEKDIINILANKFNISRDLINVYAEWSKAILSIANQGQSLIQL